MLTELYVLLVYVIELLDGKVKPFFKKKENILLLMQLISLSIV